MAVSLFGRREASKGYNMMNTQTPFQTRFGFATNLAGIVISFAYHFFNLFPSKTTLEGDTTLPQRMVLSTGHYMPLFPMTMVSVALPVTKLPFASLLPLIQSDNFPTIHAWYNGQSIIPSRCRFFNSIATLPFSIACMITKVVFRTLGTIKLQLNRLIAIATSGFDSSCFKETLPGTTILSLSESLKSIATDNTIKFHIASITHIGG